MQVFSFLAAGLAATALTIIPAGFTSPAEARASALVDHHCAIPGLLVGHWVMLDNVMLRNGAPGPRMSQTSGARLEISCEGGYVEDAAGATITAGPDMPTIPGGHSPQECVYTAGGSSGQIEAVAAGLNFRPSSAAAVIPDQLDCGMIGARFGLHLHMGQNPWSWEISGDSLTLIQTMQSTDAGEIAFRLNFERVD